MSQAAFTINGTPSVDPTTGDRVYVATNLEQLVCTLEVNPTSVLSVRFELYDPNDLASPLASKDAPLRTWNENGAASYLLPDVNGDATVDMPAIPALPATGMMSYFIRCTVATAGDGSPNSQQQVFERLVVIKSVGLTVPIRKTVPGETTEGYARGWSDALNEMCDAMSAFAGGGPTGGYSAIGAKAVDIPNVENIVGGFRLNPGGNITWNAVGLLTTTAVDGAAEVRLYDMGEPGTPIVPVLRSTLDYPTAVDGDFTEVNQALTLSAAPGVDADEIYNTERLYEVRLILNPGGVGDPTDAFVLNRVGVKP